MENTELCIDGQAHNYVQLLGEDGTPQTGVSTDGKESPAYILYCTKCGVSLDLYPFGDDDEEDDADISPNVEYKSPEPAQSPDIPSPYMKT